MVTRNAGSGRRIAAGGMLLFLLISAGPTRGEIPLPSATIVVYNSEVPESVTLAKFYAEKRGIARDHLVALRCPVEEEITRGQYDTSIRDPLREVFRERDWWQTTGEGAETRVTTSSIKFVALMKGMPLKVHTAEAYPGDKVMPGPIGGRNEASVDSELVVLARFAPQISGAINNPYF